MQSKSFEGGSDKQCFAGMVQSRVECGISRELTDFRLVFINISPPENIRKENERTILLMNMDANIFYKYW